MNRIKLAAFFALSLMQFAVSTAEEFPSSMVGFVKPNDHVGLARDRTTGNYLLSIFTQEEYSLAKDVRLLDEAALILKYPDVGTELARLRAKGEQERQAPRADGSRLGRTRVSVSAPAGELYKVVHVGNNYLLLEAADAKAGRLVLNAASIISIRWNPALQYNSQHKVLRGNETEPDSEPDSF